MESSLSGSLRCADCSTAKSLALVCPALTKTARPALRDQIERASSSIALLVAEGNTPFPQVGWAQALDARAVIATTSSRWLRAAGQARFAASSTSPVLRPLRPRRSAPLWTAAACALDRLASGYVTGCLSPADATRAKHKLTRIVQMLVGLRRSR